MRPSAALDASMVTKSWSSAKASKRKESAVPKETLGGGVSVASLPAVEEQFEVEAILDHRKVKHTVYCLQSGT